MEERTKNFAIRIIKAAVFLERQTEVERILGRQLLRSGTSIGANYRESRAAQSEKDFLNKLEIALKEALETEYWIELIRESGLSKSDLFTPLAEEANELVRILRATTKKLKSKS